MINNTLALPDCAEMWRSRNYSREQLVGRAASSGNAAKIVTFSLLLLLLLFC